MSKIKIYLNGKETEIEGNLTVRDLLDQLGNKSTMLVVERNFEIIPSDKYETFYIQEHDNIEVVTFAGGG